jgi:hypothetical protein
MMIDSQSAVQLAVFSALNADASVIALADVWQNPPENTQPGEKGLVIIGLVVLDADQDMDGTIDRATISVFTQIRKTDARELYALNSAVRNALDGQPITASGAIISKPSFLSAEPKMMADGQTYEDELRFEMFVQSA